MTARTPNRRRTASGFALLGALFLLVVLAALGAFMVNISGTMHFIPLLAWQGAGTYHAARTGTEWGSVRALALGACPAVPGSLSPPGGLNGGNLDGYRITVTLDGCTTHREGSANFRVYTVSATAETVAFAYGQSGFALRRTTVSVTDAP